MHNSHTAEYLGFSSYPPAYLSPQGRGRNILNGVNFASAASGYYDRTAQLFVRSYCSIHTITSHTSFTNLKKKLMFAGGNHITTAAKKLQRLAKQSCESRRKEQSKCNILGRDPSHKCREQRLYAELLHQSITQPALHPRSILRNADQILHFHNRGHNQF